MFAASGASAQDVVEFQHALPAMNITSPRNGTYNNYELGYPGILTTSDPDLGLMIWALRNSICQDRRLVFAEGRTLCCCNNWIRDHVHVMKSSCHWEYDLCSFLDFIIDHQRADGCYYELIKQIDDRHWSYVDEDCRIMLPEDNLALVRLEVEADIEYLVVEGAYLYYSISGDRKWLRKVMPHLEKGIEYITSDPKRWDKAHGLVKRAYTIDTWDFTYMPDAGENRRIEPGKTPMSIMHGDNSGVWQAMNQLAVLNRALGKHEKSAYWKSRAADLREHIFRYLWNGRHFIHQLPLDCPPYDEYEAVRLSLSNTYDINRGITDIAQSRSIIEEYMARRDTTSAFAEWFSIDPPYRRFYIYDQGKYINGCISPFTAGELAKAALENGYESYGWDIIRRCMELVRRDGGVKFLYSPATGMPASTGAGPSAWGAAAILSAIDESLAGIRNSGCAYDRISFSPRFPVTHYKELRYFTGYEVNGTHVALRYILADAGMRYQLTSPARHIDAHILLPDGKECSAVLVNGREMPFSISKVGDSRYVDLGIKADGIADIQIVFRKNMVHE